MGKQSGKKKKLVVGGNSGDSYGKPQKVGESSPRAYDKDMAVFIAMSQELKEEGNRLFQKRDYEGAMSQYEKALKLLPRVHIDVSYLRSNMAACYMQMGLSEYPRAINECNLALELTPKYSKALLKRARCYEALNRLDLALRDVTAVLNIEPNNVMALEIADRVKATIAEKGLTVNNGVIELPPDYVEPPSPSSLAKRVKEKARKKKSNRTEAKKPVEDSKEAYNAGKPKENISEQVFDRSKAEEGTEEKKPEDKAVVEERITSIKEEVPTRAVKLILGEDIRWAQVPYNCSLLQVREVVQDRFPGSGSVLVKYRDQEGDLVTITTDEELRWAEASAEAQGSLRLYVVQVNPDQDPFLGKLADSEDADGVMVKQKSAVPENGHEVKANGAAQQSTCIDDWIIHFAQLFKNHVGLDSDEYLDLHELGMKLYAEAMEETITSDEAQNIFSIAAEKFQEMAALALFNWGNVHMSRARKGVHLTEDAPEGSVLEQIKNAYDQALKEYKTAGRRYEEALKIKPDFYEGHLAVGQQQFEQAKLSFYYELSCKSDVKSFPYSEILQLYNYAEDNMEKGMQMWEEWEEQRDKDLKKSSTKVQLQQLGLDRSYNDITANEAAEQAAAMRSQINLLWGSMLYERSITEFKLGLPVWHESLEVAVEKFELAGASPTDIAVMVKNHCSNDSAIKGLEFKIDEIVQAWNEIYEAKKWQSSVPSFRLEPLFRRRTSRLHHVLEHP